LSSTIPIFTFVPPTSTPAKKGGIKEGWSGIGKQPIQRRGKKGQGAISAS